METEETDEDICCMYWSGGSSPIFTGGNKLQFGGKFSSRFKLVGYYSTMGKNMVN